MLGWATTTYGVLAGSPPTAARTATSTAACGCVSGTEVLPEATAVPWWAAAVPDLPRCATCPSRTTAGWRFTAPVVDMPRYLTWLTERGGRGSAAR